MIRAGFLLGLALTLSACVQAAEEDALDAQLRADVAAGIDPAIEAALSAQIMTDPGLVSIANRDAVRPPSYPYGSPIPRSDVAARAPAAELIAAEKLTPAPTPSGDCDACTAARAAPTLAVLARRQPVAAGCAGTIGYSQGWANRLPAGVPLAPNARVMEAAGLDAAGCVLRAVRFWTDLPPDRTIDWYATQTAGAGYRIERRAGADGESLSGTRKDGGFVAILRPRDGGGTDIDLVANDRS